MLPCKAKARYLAFEDTMLKKWPIVSEERLVQTSFGKTFMRISGPTDAPPLVLLPGGGSNSLIWSANIKALSEKYRTYALDNIYDYGRSVYTREIAGGNEFAQWLDELFDILHLDSNVRIIGYSYGGWVASQYALNHPERLIRVVLIAPPFTVLPLTDDYLLRMVATLIPVRYFKKKIMYWVWNDLTQMGDSGKEIVEDRIDYYQIALKCFKFKQPVNPTILTDEELQSITVPTLYLIGKNETMYDPQEAIERLNRVAPDIKTEMLSGCGHDLIIVKRVEINKRILEFLEEN